MNRVGLDLRKSCARGTCSLQDLKRVVLAACGTRHFASSSTSNVRSDLRVELTKSKFAYCKRRALSMSEQVESVIVFGTLLPLFVLLDRRIEKTQLQSIRSTIIISTTSTALQIHRFIRGRRRL